MNSKTDAESLHNELMELGKKPELGVNPKAIAMLGLMELQKELVQAYVERYDISPSQKKIMLQRVSASFKVMVQIAQGVIP